MSQQVESVSTNWTARLRNVPSVYIVPKYKFVYLSTAKNACTAIKWSIAEVAGEDMSRFQHEMRLGPHLYEDQAVHTRGRFHNALMAHRIDPETARDMRPENGWFIFGVVRDPRVRLFSAWQDKFLLHEPKFDWAMTEPWFPHYPVGDADSIVADFARFVDVFGSDQELPLLRNDPHFRSQAESLRADIVPFSEIYPMEDLGRLQADLNTHLQAMGRTEPVTFRRSNSTPLAAIPAVFANGVREKIENIYRDDFDRFGELFDFSRVEKAEPWSKAAVKEARVRSGLGRRVSVVRRIAITQRHRALEAEEQLIAAGARIEKAERRVAQLEKRQADTRRRLTAAEAKLAARPSARVKRVLKRTVRRAFETRTGQAVLRSGVARRLKATGPARRMRDLTY